MAWNWNDPTVVLRAPNTRIAIPAAPQPWNHLSFDPLSAYDLRRHQGAITDEPGRFMLSRENFLASDLVWLATGACSDGQHAVDPNSFFSELDRLRLVTPSGTAGNAERKTWGESIRKAIFDLATKWDRSMGSTTMVLHVEGTTIPGAPLAPEYMKAHICIPPSFLTENPASHAAIASIVQSFIEDVGIPTAAAWTRKAHARGWSLTQQPGNLPVLVPDHLMPLIPTPAPRSSYYIFPGCVAAPVAGALPPPPALIPVPMLVSEPLPVSAPILASVPVPALASSPPEVIDIDEIDFGATEAELYMALERNLELNDEIKTLTRVISHYETQEDTLLKAGNASLAREHALRQRILTLEAEIARLRNDVRQAEVLVPPTSSRFTRSQV
ncbi:hypothetical protein FB451DRAFT_1249411, partial [Mycena latifolia]